MSAYVLRRLLLLLPILFGISVLAFSLARFGGDPAEGYVTRVYNNPHPTQEQLGAVRRELGLDRPLVHQYAAWSSEAVRGRFGVSYTTSQPVTTEFGHRLPVTLRLALPTLLLSLMLGIPLGIIAAVHRGRLADHILRLICLAGASVPGFVLAIVLISVFAVRLRILPIIYQAGAAAIVLPTLTMALPMASWLARLTRSAMLQTLGDDYVRTARAKGLRHQLVMERHVLVNALVPLVTVFGSVIAHLLAGAAIIETIYAWPGLGALAVDAVKTSDFPVIQAFVVYTGTLFVIVNLLVDLAYRAIDPRIRLIEPAV